MKTTVIAALVVASTAFAAAAQQVKLEDQVKYRRAAYDLMGLNFGSLSAMAQGKKPFDKDEAARNAEFVALLATVPQHYFGEGTDKDTKAKPGIWSHRADFDSKMKHMIEETAKLPAAVRGADLAAFKQQVDDVSHACKACHDDYRAK